MLLVVTVLDRKRLFATDCFRPKAAVHESLVAIPSLSSAFRLILELPISFNYLILVRECHLQSHLFPLLGSTPDVGKNHKT